MGDAELEFQISERRRRISAQSLSMSISELTSMYEDGDLIINPDFQRLFRWNDGQKSRLIESLLLGIPVPSLFMVTTEDGRWEVVDGLQRISTILQIQGKLIDPDGKPVDPLILTGTKYLPALDGMRWNIEAVGADEGNSLQHWLSPAQQRDIRRARLDVVIIDRQSDTESKYDLFQRLNSYGSSLVAQELRQAMIVAESPRISDWLTKLSKNEFFTEVLDLSEAQSEKGYGKELALRFVVLHDRAFVDGFRIRDLSSFLDDAALDLGRVDQARLDEIEHTFESTFQYFAKSSGLASFESWNSERDRVTRRFSIMAFEILALGVGYHIAKGNYPSVESNIICDSLWKRKDFNGYASGKSAEARMRLTVPFGREFVSDYLSA